MKAHNRQGEEMSAPCPSRLYAIIFYALPVAFSSCFIIEKINIAEIEQHATSTPQTIHNGIGPHR